MPSVADGEGWSGFTEAALVEPFLERGRPVRDGGGTEGRAVAGGGTEARAEGGGRCGELDRRPGLAKSLGPAPGLSAGESPGLPSNSPLSKSRPPSNSPPGPRFNSPVVEGWSWRRQAGAHRGWPRGPGPGRSGQGGPGPGRLALALSATGCRSRSPWPWPPVPGSRSPWSVAAPVRHSAVRPPPSVSRHPSSAVADGPSPSVLPENSSTVRLPPSVLRRRRSASVLRRPSPAVRPPPTIIY
jgi:hypothetical protein